jgi:hypothetical protein
METVNFIYDSGIGSVIEFEKESEAFQEIVRAQITTSAFKQCVYYAFVRSKTEEKDKKVKVFVKGPFVNEKTVEDLGKFHDWKKKNSIHAGDFCFVYLYPDKWPEGVPLGYRNRCDRSKKYLFMVSKPLLDDEDVKTKKHTTKLWPETEILESDRSWDPVKMWGKVSDEAKSDYVIAVLYKSLIGVKDLADKNFCYYKGNVYSIDEDELHREFYNPIEALPLTKRKLFLTHFLANFDHFHNIVKAWSPLGNFNKPLLDFMDDIAQKIRNRFDFTKMSTAQTVVHELEEYKELNEARKKKSKAIIANNAVPTKTKNDENDDDQQEQIVAQEKAAAQGPRIEYRNTISSNGHKDEELISGIHKYMRRGNDVMLTYVFSQLLSYTQADQSRERKAKLTKAANRIVISSLEDTGTSPHMLPFASECSKEIKFFNSLEGDAAKTAVPKPDNFVRLAYYASQSKRARISSGLNVISKVFEFAPIDVVESYDTMFFDDIMLARTKCFVDGEVDMALAEKFFIDSLKEMNKCALVVYKSLYDRGSTVVTGLKFLRYISSLLRVRSGPYEDAFVSIKGKKEEFMMGGNLLFWYLVGTDAPPATEDQERISELIAIFTDKTKRELDSYVVNDRHVKLSKFGMKEFVEQGSLVTNHSDIPVAIALRKIYENARINDYTPEDLDA